MSFSSDIKDELLELKMWDLGSNMKQDEQLARLYIREAFIKSGSMNDPNKKYHLQIMFKEKEKSGGSDRIYKKRETGNARDEK